MQRDYKIGYNIDINSNAAKDGNGKDIVFKSISAEEMKKKDTYLITNRKRAWNRHIHCLS